MRRPTFPGVGAAPLHASGDGRVEGGSDVFRVLPAAEAGVWPALSGRPGGPILECPRFGASSQFRRTLSRVPRRVCALPSGRHTTIISAFSSSLGLVADAGGAADAAPEASEHNLSPGMSGALTTKGAPSADGASGAAGGESMGVPSSPLASGDGRSSSASLGVSVSETGSRF